MDDLVRAAVLLWAVIDPIGTVPVFLAVTQRHPDQTKRRIAVRAITVAAIVLVVFMLLGQVVLEAMSIPLAAFRVSGGVILFLFALSMIFGVSKPEGELEAVRSHQETAVYPLAVPSIASPGAILAVVLLTDNHRFDWVHELRVAAITFAVLGVTLAFMMFAGRIQRVIGESGASVVSRIMGMILGAAAANDVLGGLKEYFIEG